MFHIQWIMINTFSTEIQDLPEEVWEFIPGYGFNYQISNFGRVKSLIKNRPQILTKTLSCGRYKVLLYKKVGRYTNESVGRLLARVFQGEPEENDVVKYRDNNPFHDFADNVYWLSRKECSRNKNKGQSNAMAKLNDQKVSIIRSLVSDGKSYKEISKEFGVDPTHVYKIAKNKCWNHVKSN